MSQKAAETKTQSHGPSAETKRLELFAGKWNVKGKSYAQGSSNEILQVSPA